MEMTEQQSAALAFLIEIGVDVAVIGWLDNGDAVCEFVRFLHRNERFLVAPEIIVAVDGSIDGISHGIKPIAEHPRWPHK